MWVLVVNAGHWTEVTPPESMKPRHGHSLTATSLGPGLTEVLLFGGQKTFGGASIAETTILRFECNVSSTGRWSLVYVAHNDTRGSTHRLREKNRIISQAKARSIDQLSPDCVRALEEQLRAAQLREREI